MSALMPYGKKAQDAIPATVCMISGCQDEQTSADIQDVGPFQLPTGGAGGACTSAFLQALYNAPSGTWGEVLKEMRSTLRERQFDQVPQLTSSRPLQMSRRLDISGKGTKRAVLIGINYAGQDGELAGCRNDVRNIREYLMKVQGFLKSDIAVLLDDNGKHTAPTRRNILKALNTVAKMSEPGDSIFVQYSGHGGRIRDDNGDESDGFDETIIPLDFQEAGHIKDDELIASFIKPIKKGVIVTCLMDCCHSGTVLDLPYQFVSDDKSKSDSMKRNSKMQFGKFALSPLAALPLTALPQPSHQSPPIVEEDMDGKAALQKKKDRERGMAYYGFIGCCTTPHGWEVTVCVILSSIVGLIASIYSIASCRFVQLTFISSNGGFDSFWSGPTIANTEPRLYTTYVGLFTWLNANGIEISSGQSVGAVCTGYNQTQREAINDDTFGAVQIFAIMVVLFGVMAVFLAIGTSMVAMNRVQLWGLGLSLGICLLCESLVFMVLQSGLCTSVEQDSECSLDEGAYVAIVAISMWAIACFACAVFLRVARTQFILPRKSMGLPRRTAPAPKTQAELQDKKHVENWLEKRVKRQKNSALDDTLESADSDGMVEVQLGQRHRTPYDDRV